MIEYGFVPLRVIHTSVYLNVLARFCTDLNRYNDRSANFGLLYGRVDVFRLGYLYSFTYLT